MDGPVDRPCLANGWSARTSAACEAVSGFGRPGATDMSPADFVVHEARLLDERRHDEWLALFADDGRSYARISQDIGIPVGSIGPTRARVLAQLRRQLNAAR